MKAYADSNFFVRLHLSTDGYEDAKALVSRIGTGGHPALPVTWLHRVEVANAFQYHVFLARQGMDVRLSPETAAAALARFLEDVESGSYGAAAQVLPTLLEARFQDLSLRHTARHGFRTYDLLHVASALILGCDTFWSFDRKACRLATLEGLKVPRRLTPDA